MSRARRFVNRRGVTVVQWAVLAAVIVIAVVAAVRNIGNNTRTHMNTTAGNVGNPSSLPSRFGS